MNPQTIEACAEFSEKTGKIVAALIREQPGCISTIAFVDFATLSRKFFDAIKNDPTNTIRGSEIFQEFREARQWMEECLEAERRQL